MLGVAVLLGLGNYIGLLDRPPVVNSPAAFDTHRLDIDAPMPVLRAGYNYSVIPGGAFSERELERAINRDPVVAQHYRDVDASTMRPEIVKADRLAYVSYRLGDRVYWTSKKVRIRSGETILSNGRQEIRARCGNCISLEPLMPTSADEPDPMQLEALTDTGPVLVGWPLNPWIPLAASGPVGVEMPPLVTPQVAIPLFPFPLGFAGGPTTGGAGETDPGTQILFALSDPAGGIIVPTPLEEGLPPAEAMVPGGVMLPLLTGLGVPDFPGDPPFRPDSLLDPPDPLFDPPDPLFDEPTTRVLPPPPREDATPVPEPATLLLLGGGIAGLIARRWRANRRL